MTVKFVNDSFSVAPIKNGRIRFRLGKMTGFIAVRKHKSRGYGVEDQRCFSQLHLGKISIAVEKSSPERQLWNFADTAEGVIKHNS